MREPGSSSASIATTSGRPSRSNRGFSPAKSALCVCTFWNRFCDDPEWVGASTSRRSGEGGLVQRDQLRPGFLGVRLVVDRLAVLPDCWEMNFEEVGIALCRTLTEEPDRLNRVLSGLESVVLDEFVGRQERNELLNPADLSDFIVAGIAGMLREAFSMSRAYAASLVERHYTGVHAPA